MGGAAEFGRAGSADALAVLSLLLLPSLDFTVLRAWLALPMSGFLTLLLVAVLTYHAYLGSVVIVEDYVHGTGEASLMVSLRFLFVLCAGARACSRFCASHSEADHERIQVHRPYL